MFDGFGRSLVLLCTIFMSFSTSEDVIVRPWDSNVPLVCSFSNPKWMKDEKTIEASDKGYMLVQETRTLIIKKIDHEHMGAYVCADASGQRDNINVYVRPYVKPFQGIRNIIQEDPMELVCKGFGHPTPVVEWFVDDIPLIGSDRISMKDTQKRIDSGVLINGTIRIQKMDLHDSGEYVCVAKNSVGFKNTSVTVNVKDKLAALWPFLGICAEVILLCVIIFIYEKRHTKRLQEEEDQAPHAEEGDQLANANNEGKGVDDFRQRKQ